MVDGIWKPSCETCDSSLGAERHDEPRSVPEKTFQTIFLKEAKIAKKMTPTMLEKWREHKHPKLLTYEMRTIPWLYTESTRRALTNKAHALSSYATEDAHSCHQTLLLLYLNAISKRKLPTHRKIVTVVSTFLLSIPKGENVTGLSRCGSSLIDAI